MSQEPAETAPPMSINPAAIITLRLATYQRSCWRSVGLEPRPDHLLSVVTIVTHQLQSCAGPGTRAAPSV